MELPNLGKQCTNPTCNQLDYLPLKCDACGNIFCKAHVSYNQHNCPSAYKKDVQVPVCPLCNIPIPVKRGEQPDIAVGAHIDSDCQSDPAKDRRKVFVNKCSFKNCRVKEMIPVLCSDCKLNFCLKHRFPADHKCEGAVGAARRRAVEAAASRQAKANSHSSTSNANPPRSSKTITPSRPQQAHSGPFASFTSVQGSMSEDEALARALALSMQDSEGQASGSANDEDLMLARAIAESERRHTSPNTSKSSCNVA